jgi:hypothetical protein
LVFTPVFSVLCLHHEIKKTPHRVFQNRETTPLLSYYRIACLPDCRSIRSTQHRLKFLNYTIMKSTIKTYGIVAIALIAFTLVFSTSTLANNDKEKSTAHIELKFIGHYENQPVFQLNLKNTEEDEYSITFRDDYGNVLYAAKVKGTNITKKFMLNIEEIGDNVLNVEVKAKKSNTSEVYKINRNRSYVEETVVSRIK